MVVEIYLLMLLVFMIVGAVIAVETENLLSSVISLGAIGFGLSIAFLFLGAPDLAIVQIAVEAVFLIFFIRATISRDVVASGGHINWGGLITASILMIVFFVFSFFAFEDLWEFGRPVIEAVREAPSNKYIEAGLEETGAANIVTSVILDYRGYDTLGEATVLFTAIVGALTVLRGRARIKRGGDR
ncbi:MAG: hydrogen gas-evolving membrane-bound hydrogenase subunit E [bacterium]